MIRSAAGVVLAALLAAPSGHASAGTYEACVAGAAGVMPKLHACDAAELQSRNDNLNSAYQDLLRTLAPARQEKLRAAERAWLGFEAAECSFRRSADAGAMNAPLDYSRCQLDLLSQRLAQLRQALKVAKF